MDKKVLIDLFIIPDYDKSRIVVTFTAPEGCTQCKWEIIDEGISIKTGCFSALPCEKESFDAAIENFKPWNINSPYLYTLKLILSIRGEDVEISTLFGMRKIHVSSTDIYVNNEKFQVRGYIRGREAHDHPNLEGLSMTQYYEKNIRAAKDYGFNYIRFHSRIPSEECFEVADRLGMFIHVEIRKYYGKYQKERTMMNDAGELINEEDWREAILQLRSHPSLMVYCMGNEIRHPGTNPQVEHIAKVTKELDPTRLFIDTCAHGEFDRTYVDFDVQHMSYFYPFAENYDMFENTYNWCIYGSCKGTQLVDQDNTGDDFTYRVTRSMHPKRPILAHEICHYIALRDIYNLDEKFTRLGVVKPWWIAELKKLIHEKGLENDYMQMFKASRKFQFISWKLGIEAARRSRLLSGFHFLQLSDTDRYENSNGLIDCFDDKTGTSEKEFLKFNGDSVLLADLPRRTYFEGEKIRIPVIVSHYSDSIRGDANFSFQLRSIDDTTIFIHGGIQKINMDENGRHEICDVEIIMPEVDKPKALLLEYKLESEDHAYEISNDWSLWLYPNKPNELAPLKCTVVLDDINLGIRYPQIQSCGTPDVPEKLMIGNRFTPQVLHHLENGGDVLMLYRVPETRDREVKASKETYYLPSTWDRMKSVIWDRGTNLGGFIRDNNVLNDFPNDGYIDLQFHALIDDCDKIVLDDFPCHVDPLIQGVDKAVRDRFDVYTFGLSELQPEWTMRKFAYLFELRVGKGHMLISGFNFTGLNDSKPETCAMFESFLRYVTSDKFEPNTFVSTQELEKYLLHKGKSPRVKERKMTQYWQLNDAPLESDKYWKEAEEYIRQE